ncbi:GNAT family N-acetyltransferase [Heyndrickxia sp. NPDC080065]|uniref:GNAT family N-acetyltransferase n=1 Tax=Heyndrickxia sp. NPDC080065 TaxID=3390568 RepID=UPI003CFE93FA
MNTKNVMIKLASSNDWEQVWSLLEKRGATDSKEQAEIRFHSVIESTNYLLPIALVDDRIAGYGWAQDYGYHLRAGTKTTRFHDLFVLSEYRNQGVATAIFETIKSWAKENGSNWFTWNANPTSSSFYTKLGYTPIPEEEEGFPFYEIEFKPMTR